MSKRRYAYYSLRIYLITFIGKVFDVTTSSNILGRLGLIDALYLSDTESRSGYLSTFYEQQYSICRLTYRLGRDRGWNDNKVNIIMTCSIWAGRPSSNT